MAQTNSKRSNRGLASADPETRARVARAGGHAVSRNRAHMALIGKKGGEAVSQNRQHMAEIGRKGGGARSASQPTNASANADNERTNAPEASTSNTDANASTTR